MFGLLDMSIVGPDSGYQWLLGLDLGEKRNVLAYRWLRVGCWQHVRRDGDQRLGMQLAA